MTDILFNFLFDTVLNAGPTLADVTALLSAASAPSVEHHVAAPAAMPSIESVLALPDGFRAVGYEALTIIKSGAGN